MKIEKINENQIRCTLTSEDLNSRNIRLNELAYGSPKARQLFQDMMQEAHYEFGFESGNSPLMIEAIPTASGSITLIITKVDDPEELDARFSRFTQTTEDAVSPGNKQLSGADDILDLFRKIQGDDKIPGKDTTAKDADTPTAAPASSRPRTDLIQSFRFQTLDDVIAASRGLNHSFRGKNTLYKNLNGDGYTLLLHQFGTTPEDFNRTCNILSEYGEGTLTSPAGFAYYREHGDALIQNNAIQKLADI